MHPRIDSGNVGLAAGLDEHGSARVTQLAQQRQRARLQQRLAAGQLDERRAERQRLGEYVGARHAGAAVKCVRRVAP